MRLKNLLAGLIPSLFALVASNAVADVHYRITADPGARSIRMRVQLDEAAAEELLQIPAWSPGYYRILEYQKQISGVRASSLSGEPLKIAKNGERGWKVLNPKKEGLLFTYRVLGTDPGLGFFGVHVGPTSAFINGAAGFVYSKAHMLERQLVEVNVPFDWDVATPMERVTEGKVQEFAASNYDEMIDCPIQMGHFARKSFTSNGIPFEAIWVCDDPIASNLDEETKRLATIVPPAIQMFKGAPFKRYTFFVHLAVGDFAGGLEHRSSAVIATRNTPQVWLDDLATHEFFHAWNVKNIRPAVLGPFDYSQPVRTGNLWFAEGVTDYYGKIHAYQSGVRSMNWLLESYSNEIEDLQAGKVRLTKTLEQACKETWESTAFGYGDLSFYTKGQIVGLIFDARLRGVSKGKKSLDDVMRLMMSQYALPKPGYEEDGILKALEQVSGESYAALYKKCVQSVEELPYDEIQQLGLRVVLPEKSYVDPQYQLDEKFFVTQVSPSIRYSGLTEGDKVIEAKLVGEADMKLTVQRVGKTLTILAPGRKYKAVDFRLQINPFATTEQRQRFEEWRARPVPTTK